MFPVGRPHDPALSYNGLRRDLNPGPPAPKAGIIPLDHEASLRC